MSEYIGLGDEAGLGGFFGLTGEFPRALPEDKIDEALDELNVKLAELHEPPVASVESNASGYEPDEAWQFKVWFELEITEQDIVEVLRVVAETIRGLRA